MKKHILLLIIVIIASNISFGQELKKADHFFSRSAFLDAAELYLEIDAKSQQILQKLGDCYYFNTDMKNATLWYKVLMDEHLNAKTLSPQYIFKYAQALKGIEKYDEAYKWFEIYNESQNNEQQLNIKTTAFIQSLNDQIDRPYIIHKIDGNSKVSDFGLSIQNSKAIFASNRNGGNIYAWNKQPYLDLYEATIDNEGNLTNITAFEKSINTKMHESNGVLTNDGLTLYFTRNDFKDGKKGKDENKVNHLKIYKAQLVEGKWTNLTELPFNSNTYSTTHPALSPDGSKLYFASDMPGTIGSFDLFVVDVNKNGTYGTPKNLGPSVNTNHREQFPFISSTETLYFASDGHLGLGGLDIYKSTLKDGSFEVPVNLSDNINSHRDDFAFSIDEENEIGYFSSNRIGGIGDDDIYRFTQLKRYYITGKAKNKNTSELLPGTFVTLSDSSNNLISKMTTGNDAVFSFEIEPNMDYIIKGSLKLFNTSKIYFSTDKMGNIDKEIFLLLEAYQDAEETIVVENKKIQIKIDPIFFEFGKWDIRPDAALELDKIVAIMKKYPDMILEIGAHTDVRGSNEYNMELSHKRAASVREYLVSNGISNKNVQSKGYGESQPLNKCVKERICTEKEYNINRRCEFVILN